MAVYQVGESQYEIPDNVQGEQLQGILTQLAAQEAPKQQVEQPQDFAQADTESLLQFIESGQATPEQEAQISDIVSQRELTQEARTPRQMLEQQRDERLSFPEFVGTLGTSTVAQPISGLAGLGAIGTRAVGLTEADPADVVRAVQNAMTYIPEGTQAREDLMKVGQLMENTFGVVERAAGDIGAAALSPFGQTAEAVGGAIGTTLPTAAVEAVPFVGKLKRGAQATRAIPEPPRKIRMTQEGIEATPEAAKILSGDPDAIKKASQVEIDPTTKAELENLAAFQRQGVQPATTSRITQDPSQARAEFRLGRTDSPEGDILNQRMFIEAQDIDRRFGDLINDLGDPELAGNIKDSMIDIRTGVQELRRQAYRDFADLANTSPDLVKNMPLGQQQIMRTADDVLKTYKGMPAEKAKALDETLAEYGILGTVAERGKRFTIVDTGEGLIRVRGDVTPLNLTNMEEFRKRINNIFDPADPSQAAARRELLSAYDATVADAIDQFKISGLQTDKINGLIGVSLKELSKRARSIFSKEKRVFEAKDFANDLTAIKPGTDTPKIERTRVLDKVMTKASLPLEQLNKTMKILSNTNDGRQTIGHLQAGVLSRLFDQSLKGGKVASQTGEIIPNVFNGQSFTKQLESFGRDRLKALYKNRPDILRAINDLEKIGQLRRADNASVQIGSYNLINDIMNKAANVAERVPVASLAVSATKAVKQRATKKRDFSKAVNYDLNLNPELNKSLLESAPRLAQVLGINPQILDTQDEQ
jgi:hypothetical protein